MTQIVKPNFHLVGSSLWDDLEKATRAEFSSSWKKPFIAAGLLKMERTMHIAHDSVFKVVQTKNDAAVQTTTNPTNFCTAESLEIQKFLNNFLQI